MSKASKNSGAIEANRQRCWDHYVQGWRVAAIASELQLSEGQVRSYLADSQATAKETRDQLAKDYVQRELDSLDDLEKAIYPDLADAAQVRGSAAKVILEIKARRAKYLGLDKPAEVKHSLTLEDLVAGSQIGKPEAE